MWNAQGFQEDYKRKDQPDQEQVAIAANASCMVEMGIRGHCS